MKSSYNRKLGNKLVVIGLIFFPIFLCLFIVSFHSNKLVNVILSNILPVLIGFSFTLIIIGTVHIKKDKSEKVKKKKVVKLLLIFFLIIYNLFAFTVIVLLYGSDTRFKNWLITTAMTTMTHQYYATWVYSENKINMVLSNNIVLETGEKTNPNLIVFKKYNYSGNTFANKYEKEVLIKDAGNELYKIIDIDYEGVKGKLAVIYDASKVHIGVSKGIGNNLDSSYGEYVYEMSKRYNGIIGMNGGGFIDPGWMSRGGCPLGTVISNGKLIANRENSTSSGGLIGFNKNNVLVLGNMTAQQALDSGIRDAVEFGPFLIVNGESSFIKGNGGWGLAPRSVIGQRKDGIVLFLVVDGRQASTMGADMNQLARIMWNYGAYNAANLDGGTSSSMTLNHQIITKPMNGAFVPKTRPVPNAWLLIDE